MGSVLRRFDQKGYTEVSITKIILVILMLGVLGSCIIYGSAYFEEAQVVSAIKNTLYNHHSEMDDAVLTDFVVKSMQINESIKVDPKQVFVNRGTDRNRVRVKAPYLRLVKFPVVDFVWEIPFAPDFEEDVSTARSL